MERLHKVLAHAGIASRRKCEELILERRVRVNGQIVSELGTQVDAECDRIEVDGAPVRVEKKTYIVLHKPKGYLSDIDEARGRPLAIDLVPSKERLYAAGRLDLNSEGLLLLTNDGDFAHHVTHPRYEHEKEYLALVEGDPTQETLAKLHKGVWYDGDMLRVDSAKIVRHLGPIARQQRWNEAGRDECWLRIILHEGKKREIRHLCSAVGHPVKRLIRIRIGSIELAGLLVGKYRTLNKEELRVMQSGAKEKRANSNQHRGDRGNRNRRARRVG